MAAGAGAGEVWWQVWWCECECGEVRVRVRVRSLWWCECGELHALQAQGQQVVAQGWEGGFQLIHSLLHSSSIHGHQGAELSCTDPPHVLQHQHTPQLYGSFTSSTTPPPCTLLRSRPAPLSLHPSPAHATSLRHHCSPLPHTCAHSALLMPLSSPPSSFNVTVDKCQPVRPPPSPPPSPHPAPPPPPPCCPPADGGVHPVLPAEQVHLDARALQPLKQGLAQRGSGAGEHGGGELAGVAHQHHLRPRMHQVFVRGSRATCAHLCAHGG